MKRVIFHRLLISLSIVFSLFFFATIGPASLAEPDVISAIMGGFVNPYASGYSTDVIFCWIVLLLWVIYEARTHNIKHGWICVLLGAIPGVVVGLALYLIIRDRQIDNDV